MTNNAFLNAAWQKLRFQTAGGVLDTEDLFDLTLKRLDEMYWAIKDQHTAGTRTLLENPTRKTADQQADELRCEIIKSVIEAKQEANRTARSKAAKETQRAFFKSLLEKKRLEELEGLTIEEIQAQMAQLDADDMPAEEPVEA